MRIIKTFTVFCSSIMMIIFILCLPTLVTYDQKVSFQPFLYFEDIKETFVQIFQIKELTFIGQGMSLVRLYPLFPTIWEPYIYSMILLGSTFILALILAILLSFGYMMLSVRKKKWVQRILFIFESMPDVMIIVGLQALLIWYFKQTGDQPIQILSFREKKAFFLPILCLCVLPTLQLFRMLIANLEEEKQKQYVEIAKGKGFTPRYIIAVHLFRNVFIHLFYHSKTIYLFTLSNLFVLEYIFNIQGIMRFLLDYGSFHTTIGVVVILLLLIPYYIFFIIGDFLLNKIIGVQTKEVTL